MSNKYRMPTDEEAFQAAQEFQSLTNEIKIPYQTENAFHQLDSLAEDFYRLAIDDRYQCNLPKNVEDGLQNAIQDFYDWVHCPSTQLKYFSHGPLKLINAKIIILKMARFIIWKVFGHPSTVLDHAMMIVQLVLDTSTLCHQQGCWPELKWCLKEASSYELQPTQLPANHKKQYYKNAIKLAVLQAHYTYGTMEPPCDGLVGFHVRKLNDVELDDEQLQEISDICYSLGSGHFARNDYVSAQPWLKSSYHFAKRMKAIDRSANTVRALMLLVKCLLKDDPILHRNMIIHLLGLLDENITVGELRMETWMAGKTQIEPTVQCAAKLFCIYLEEGSAEAKKQILQVFNNLKEMGHTLVIVELLNRIPWRKEITGAEECLIPTSLMPQMRWVLAEVAVLTCLMNHEREECLLVLKDIALWTPNNSSVDPVSLSVILENAKSEAFDIDSPRETLTWCQVLVDIGRRNGMCDTELLIGTICQSMSLKVEETVSWGQEILNSLIDPGMDIQLIRFKLFIAVRDNDEKKAVESCLLLETKYKKEKNLESTEWEEVCVFLEKSVEIGIEHGMSQVVVRCLNALDQELDRRNPYAIALVSHVTRFVDKILSRDCKADPIVEGRCVDLLVKMLINATRLLTVSLSNGEEKLWFGGVALRLASNTSVRTTPFHRHLLYKCHYKLLNLIPNKDEKLQEDIRSSICNAMIAGITSEERPDYIDILNASLKCVADYAGHDPIPVRFYEFYILCQLGDVARVKQALEYYSSDWSPARLNARFFSTLAGLSSSDHRAILRSILPESGNFFEGYHLPRNDNLQLALTKVAIECMRKVIHLQVNEPLTEQSISSSWQKILSLAQENIFLHEELMDGCLRIFHEYFDFIWANRELFDHSDIRLFLKQCWNVTVNIIQCKGKEAAEMWVKLMCEVPKLSPALGDIVNDGLKQLLLSQKI